jgi:hypothetical protein
VNIYLRDDDHRTLMSRAIDKGHRAIEGPLLEYVMTVRTLLSQSLYDEVTTEV